MTVAGVQLAHVIGHMLTGAKLALSLGVSMVGITLIARASVLRRQQAGLLGQLSG